MSDIPRSYIRPSSAWYFHPKAIHRHMGDLSLAAQAVLHFLIRFIPGEHRRSALCASSIIQNNTGIASANTVTKALRELVRHGWIMVTKEQNTNHYQINRIAMGIRLQTEYAIPQNLTDAIPQNMGASEETRKNPSCVNILPAPDPLPPHDDETVTFKGTGDEPMAETIDKTTQQLQDEVLIKRLTAKPFHIAKAKAVIWVQRCGYKRVRGWLEYVLSMGNRCANPAGYLYERLKSQEEPVAHKARMAQPASPPALPTRPSLVYDMRPLMDRVA